MYIEYRHGHLLDEYKYSTVVTCESMAFILSQFGHEDSSLSRLYD